MSEDHLDRETSVSVEVTESGAKAGSNSRLIAAIDRFGGNLLEGWNAALEAKSSEKRAIAESRVEIIRAATKLGIERMSDDPDLAERALSTLLGTAVKRQNNKDGVIAHAMEDLRQKPPSEEEASSGPEKLDPAFEDRFERYAEDATTDVLREKWGRVLAAEIRQPGVFSAKVLRVIDELEPETALLFEKLCAHRLSDTIPKFIADEIYYSQQMRLADAGLIIAPDSTQVRLSRIVKDISGKEIWLVNYDDFALGVEKKSEKVPLVKAKLLISDGALAVGSYLLTDVGYVIAKALIASDDQSIYDLAEVINKTMPDCEVAVFRFSDDKRQWVPLKTFPAVSTAGL